MTQIGDMVSKAGIYTNPGVVIEKKEDGTVLIDTEPMVVNKYHRYANTTGLTEEEKGRFKGYPMRTWDGNNYRGGYSDHFPTYIILLKNLK